MTSGDHRPETVGRKVKRRAVDFGYGQSQLERAMDEMPPSIRKNAEELRKLRLSQPWTSYAQALKQCRAVELRAAAASERVGEPRVSGSVTAGMSDVEFEAWLVAQGAVPMSEERRGSLNLGGNGTE
jgi:hypothetical protein